MKEFKLPSGAMLRVGLAPFKDSRNLYQSIVSELKAVKIDMQDEINLDLLKNVMFTLLASKEVEKALEECANKCLYNNERVTPETFEKEETRQDYFEFMYHVAYENIYPFAKAHFAKFETIFQKAMMGQESK